jgi:hypothetical protein
MPVFDNSVKTPLRVTDPGTDKTMPDAGSLAYGSMTGATALAGTTGIDCKLIHGDRWQEIKGNMTEHWTGNVNTNIDQNWTIQVNGMMSLTVVTGYYEEEQGPVNRYYWQVVNDTFSQDHNVSVPDSAAFQVSAYANTFVELEQIAIVFGMCLQACISLGITIAAMFDLEYKTLHAEFHPLHGDGKLVQLYTIGEDAGATGNKAEVKTEVAVRGSCNAGVDVDCGFPPT